MVTGIYFRLLILQRMQRRFIATYIFLVGLSLLSSTTLRAVENTLPEGRTFIYAPSPNWEPLDYFNFRDEHSGILAGFVTRMEMQTGIHLERIQLGSWSEILDSLEAGAAHISIGIHRTSTREAFLNFTDPFLTIPMVMLTKRDARIRKNGDLNENTLAVVRSYASSEYLMERYPNARFIQVDDELTAMIQTAYGEADAMLVDVFTAGYLMNRYGITNLALGPETDFAWRLHIGVVKSEPELFDILQEYVASLPGEYDQLLLQSPIDVAFSEPTGFWDIYQRLIIGVFVLIVLALIVFWGLNRRLNLLVAEQVGEIEFQNKKLKEIAWLQSHELRGPLCRISSIISSLKEHKNCDSETKEMLEHMEKSVGEIDAVIHTIVRKTDRLDLD